MAKHDVCPVEHAGHLDSVWRRLIQNPLGILRRYVRPGMTVLDFGCGPGVFTIPAAGMVGPEGRVIAVDLQQGMLDIVSKKIAGSKNGSRISLHLCQKDSIGISEPVDFMLAIHVIHEVPDAKSFFEEARGILKPGATLFVAEPKHHVDTEELNEMKSIAAAAGFVSRDGPPRLISSTVVFTLSEN